MRRFRYLSLAFSAFLRATMTAMLCVILFLSGASALIFESLWFHLAALVFGNSVWAASLVLAGFMAGLGLGNALIAFFGGKITFPIRFYAGLELIIAFSGIALVIVFPRLTGLLAPVFRLILDMPFTLNFARMAGAFILMLIPTTAMGATLPLVVKALCAEKAEFGRVLGALYGCNTLGAVLGLAANDILFIKFCGIQGAAFVAGGFNVLAALLAIRLSLSEKSTAQASGCASIFTLRAASLLTAGALTGCIMLGFEVVWFRLLIMFFSAHDTNFMVMLAVVLAGIGAGGLLASAWFKAHLKTDGLLAPLMFLSGLLAAALYRYLDVALDLLKIGDKYVYLLCVSLFLMFPVSCLSGLIFTMLGKALHDEIEDETRATGFLTLFNTGGALVGALGAGLFLIRFMGIEKSFFLLAALYGAAAFMAWDWRDKAGTIRARAAGCMAGAAFCLGMAMFPFGAMSDLMMRPARRWIAQAGEQRVAAREGITETIQYLRKDFLGRPHYYRLLTNNHSMSATNMRGRRYMNLYVWLPVALHPAPRNALLICYGCGCTAKALTDTKELENITMIDISRDIVDMSSVPFPDPDENPANDPRARIRIEDGRFFLLTTKEEFDIITADPPPPTYSGIVNLYTQEYFERIRDRLRAGGVATYWLPVYQLDAHETKAILKAFVNVFPNCSLWTGAEYDWIMVGIKPPVSRVSESRFAAQWRDPALAREMRAVGLANPAQLGSLFIADGKRLTDWIGAALPLVDNFPRRISHGVRGLHLPVYADFMDPARAQTAFAQSDNIAQFWPQSFRQEAEQYFSVRKIVDLLFSPRGIHEIPVAAFHECLSNPLLSDYVVMAFRSDYDAIEILRKVLPSRVLDGESVYECDSPEAYIHLAAHFALMGRHAGNEDEKSLSFTRSAQYLGSAAALLNPPNAVTDQLHKLRVYLLYAAGHEDEAEQIGEDYAQLAPLFSESGKKDINSYWEWVKAHVKRNAQ